MKKLLTSAPGSRSGRFAGGPAEELVRFTESISFDRRLWPYDIQGSMAHATMLHQIGVLNQAELKAIVNGLKAIAQEIGRGTFVWRADLEDVHMNIEASLTRRAPAGAKLHTGRSRNDQVSVDLRLWLRNEIRQLQQEINQLQHALVELGSRYSTVLIPGYTHLQRAQPVYLAHHLLAYVEMLDRDHGRLEDSNMRANECPLGSGALAGSTLPLDRKLVARMLGFTTSRGRARLTRNSMDAVSDRDFVIEFCAAAALLAVHLSRLAEDLILWSSAEFQFIRIADAYTTGSSLMPQKRNPDIAELARGKTGRVVGNLMGLLTLLKGLPMTYNRDLQEDKERLFDTADTVRHTVRIMGAMLPHTIVNNTECLHAASDSTLLATDLAEYLVRKGVPFRQAHHAVGEAVRLAEQRRVPLSQLNLQDLTSVDPHFEPDALSVFELEPAMSRRQIPGSPGTRPVRQQLAYWRKKLNVMKPTKTGLP